MAFGGKKNSERLITDGEQVDLSKASYNPDLTFTALDEETSSFAVTMDRTHFKKPLEIVMTVLEANGFAPNFENLLSCFDSLVHGVRVRASDKAGQDELITPKSFIPCLHFQLPAKNRVGFLLKKFYAEIEGYELELARLRTGELDESGNKKQTREQLKRDMERLQTENTRLQAHVRQLTEQLAQAMRSEAHVTKALESNNIIPPQLHPVLVREISLQERTLTLKSGRRSFVLPLHFVRTLPKIGDPCLLNIKNEKILDAYFYEAPGREFHLEMAEVLFVSERSCKLRDTKRKTHIWTAKHEPEIAVFSQLKRGCKVILGSIDNVIVKLSAVADQNSALWGQLVQEKHTVFQLERAREGGPNSLPIFDGKD